MGGGPAALRENKGFLSAQGLHASMMQRGIRIGLTTVYRALSAADRRGGSKQSTHAAA
ncbi:transcriptional repressor [Streptomyces sp. NPDC057557]|uniref:transcriptional repressor n=1 Tax=Streptomyces sp. NPDC057557 TaxID=3346167 RepID=UPI003695E677